MDVFAANDLAAFTTVSGTPTEATTAGRFDSSYTTKAMTFPSASAKSQQFVDDTGAAITLTDAWVHFSYWMGNVSSVTYLQLLNSSGTPVIRLFGSANNQIRIDYWNGTSFVTGTNFNAGSTLADFDLHVVCGASGSADLYVNGSLALSISGLNAAVNNLAFVQLGPTSTVSTGHSQILVSDENTVGAKVASRVPNSNGGNTAWTNDFNNIVKTGFNDTTMISSSTLNAKESYGATTATLPTNYVVSSVWFNARARLNGSSPANIKPLLRIGGTDYAGSYNIPNLSSAAFAGGSAGFSTDPSTGSAWGITNANAAELGFIVAT